MCPVLRWSVRREIETAKLFFFFFLQASVKRRQCCSGDPDPINTQKTVRQTQTAQTATRDGPVERGCHRASRTAAEPAPLHCHRRLPLQCRAHSSLSFVPASLIAAAPTAAPTAASIARRCCSTSAAASFAAAAIPIACCCCYLPPSLLSPLPAAMVNFPKKKNTHCKKCNKHESHAITWQVRRRDAQRWSNALLQGECSRAFLHCLRVL